MKKALFLALLSTAIYARATHQEARALPATGAAAHAELKPGL